ncbi:uncharacterized protein [Amphiura filiformis]|uniref:uncharacterized protein n=1 Tax=Amphiura filiformis TaxID=82378 RepID=UPI003B221993
MAASTGNVVFRFESSANKTESAGNDSDIWDDTALIKAYDKAINSLKGGGGQSADGDVLDGKNKIKSSKHSKKCKKKKRRKNKWKVGDHCQAVFSEDGQLYDAVIKSINYKSATCWVTYAGYGNEEEHHIADLLESGDIDNCASAQENDYEDSMDYSEYSHHTPHHPGMAGSDRPSSRGSQQQYIRTAYPGWLPPSPFHMSPFPPPPPVWGMAPYQTVSCIAIYKNRLPWLATSLSISYFTISSSTSSMGNGSISIVVLPLYIRTAYPGWLPPSPFHMSPFPPPPPVWGMAPYQTPQLGQSTLPAGFPFVHMPNSSNTSMGLPAVPPPPAPDVDDADDSGIHSMLMAWYMSGYHTGYYQGLRQGKRLSSPNMTAPKHDRHQRKPVLETNDLSVASDSNNTEDDAR